MKTSSLFESIPTELPEELFTILAKGRGVTIERIISMGHASAEGDWYDQETHEWVLVVKGEARLQFEGEEERPLREGDHLLIPAHARHRVVWTPDDRETIWVAVHFG
ncbi:cupin domain-containing protein [Desulfoluna sp.]|uniref:cupin domain-containing protein n=1 Tax=Desulfoluna sp. TaxID=2045199 RepID=UPI002620C14D|nr:cupin domain-containing protein [Desulfoluna sp.]